MADKKNIKILPELAKKVGESVITLKNEQYQNIVLGKFDG